MRFVSSIVILLSITCFVGCDLRPDITLPTADWTTFQSQNSNVCFEYPSPMRKETRSQKPLGLLFQDNRYDFAIMIVHGADGEHDSSFSESMIDVSLQGASPVSPREAIQVGNGQGYCQQYRVLDGYSHRVGTVIAITSDTDRLVLDVSYPESQEADYKPLLERVVGSLKFEEPSNAVTTVSLAK